MNKMHIRDAARWAERKDCLSRVNYVGEHEYMYAVYETDHNTVIKMGWNYDELSAILKEQPQYSAKMIDLLTITGEMDEEEGEARCIPDACEVREWA